MKYLPPARILFAVAALATLAGCNIIGTGLAFFQPSMPISAVHEIPKKHTVVVIVDDFRDAATSPRLCAAIASATVRHLQDDGGFKVVDPNQVQAAIAKLGDRWTGKKGEKTVSAASLGAALHADTIIYANIESAQVQLTERIYQPEVTLMVKAFDASGKRVFPLSADGDNLRELGYPVATTIPFRDLSASAQGADTQAEIKLAAQAGLELAQLFYGHQPQKKVDRMDNN